jgi:hypothetical protein
MVFLCLVSFRTARLRTSLLTRMGKWSGAQPGYRSQLVRHQNPRLVEAAKSGKTVYLLVGLNSTTTPEALAAMHELPNCAVRYFTHRIHAKVYLLDQEALVGSSNHH